MATMSKLDATMNWDGTFHNKCPCPKVLPNVTVICPISDRFTICILPNSDISKIQIVNWSDFEQRNVTQGVPISLT